MDNIHILAAKCLMELAACEIPDTSATRDSLLQMAVFIGKQLEAAEKPDRLSEEQLKRGREKLDSAVGVTNEDIEATLRQDIKDASGVEARSCAVRSLAIFLDAVNPKGIDTQKVIEENAENLKKAMNEINRSLSESATQSIGISTSSTRDDVHHYD